MHKISHMVAERGCAPEHMDAGDYIAEVEPGLQKTCNGILAKMDQNLILSATGESKVFYFNVKGDYLAELATGDAECKAAQDARVTFAEDTKIAEKDLVVTHPICFELDTEFLCIPIWCPSEFRRGVRDGTCCLRGCDLGARVG